MSSTTGVPSKRDNKSCAEDSTAAPLAKKQKKSTTSGSGSAETKKEDETFSETGSTSSTSHEEKFGDVDEEDVLAGASPKDAGDVHPVDATAYRTEKAIRILSRLEDCPDPITSFEALGKWGRSSTASSSSSSNTGSTSNYIIPSSMLKVFETAGYKTPSPIQAQAWPVALQGRDMIGNAETGSGKTMAFLIPAVAHILSQAPLKTATSFSRDWWNAESGPICLVLAPTRELAQQIEEGAAKFGAVGGAGGAGGAGAKKVLGASRLGLNNDGSGSTSNASSEQVVIEEPFISSPRPVRSTVLVGGTSKGPQIRDLNRGSEIIIATPGRLLDLLDMAEQPHANFVFNLNRVSFLVLDEADRMLDMGFEKDLRRIVAALKNRKMPVVQDSDDHKAKLERVLQNNQSNGGASPSSTSSYQTLMFSATWPKEVQKLARDLCRSDQQPVHIHVGEGTIGELKANPRITQNIALVDAQGNKWNEESKIARMKEILQEEKTKCQEKEPGSVLKTVVFTMTKRGCDTLAWRLKSMGALAIHGDKTQADRDWCLAEFKKENGGYDILVATDVAARGLDVKNVKCVINADFPLNIEDYVHRIGRTGRAGTYGASYSFFVAEHLMNAPKSAYDLCGILRKAEQPVPVELMDLADKCRGGGKGKGKGKGKKGKGKGGKGGKGKGGGKGKW
ncbi:unnamed protein product [Amoebophrya sp. A25]|nr:unnamed protein product [Amoebophrya sp. A25]|eukprot:GSA25T00018405001.1